MTVEFVVRSFPRKDSGPAPPALALLRFLAQPGDLWRHTSAPTMANSGTALYIQRVRSDLKTLVPPAAVTRSAQITSPLARRRPRRMLGSACGRFKAPLVSTLVNPRTDQELRRACRRSTWP